LNILHRDVHIGNILITEELDTLVRVTRLTAKIIDLGMAQEAFQPLCEMLRSCWVAPECMDIYPSYGKPSDVFSFGYIIWQMAKPMYVSKRLVTDLLVDNKANHSYLVQSSAIRISSFLATTSSIRAP